MKLKVSARAGEFFDLFVEGGSNLASAARLLKDLVDDFDEVELKAKRIQDREHEGDEITHAIIRRLNTTFITPMDREDIYALASALDDVLDAIEAVADLFSGDYKAMDVLKWKDVIENLEESIDGLENVANIVESTVLKHA